MTADKDFMCTMSSIAGLMLESEQEKWNGTCFGLETEVKDNTVSVLITDSNSNKAYAGMSTSVLNMGRVMDFLMGKRAECTRK